jgi:hypothetical protein
MFLPIDGRDVCSRKQSKVARLRVYKFLPLILKREFCEFVGTPSRFVSGLADYLNLSQNYPCLSGQFRHSRSTLDVSVRSEAMSLTPTFV